MTPPCRFVDKTLDKTNKLLSIKHVFNMEVSNVQKLKALLNEATGVPFWAQSTTEVTLQHLEDVSSCLTIVLRLEANLTKYIESIKINIEDNAKSDEKYSVLQKTNEAICSDKFIPSLTFEKSLAAVFNEPTGRRPQRIDNRRHQIQKLALERIVLFAGSFSATQWAEKMTDCTFESFIVRAKLVRKPQFSDPLTQKLRQTSARFFDSAETHELFLDKFEKTKHISHEDPLSNKWHFRQSACHGTSSLSNISVNNVPSVNMTDASDETCPEGSVASDTTTLPKLLTLDELENDSKDAATLLKLFCFLDGSNIPCGMLLRAGQPRQQWSSQGEVEDVHPSNVGFNSDLLSVISEKQKIINATQRLETLGFISIVATNSFDSPFIKLDSETESGIEHSIEDHDEWMRQALLLVHFTFPLDQSVHMLFGDIGRSQISQVQHVTKHLAQLQARRRSRFEIGRFAETLLSASQFSERAWKLHALELVRKILQDNDCDLGSHLWPWLEFRTAIVQRSGDANGNELEQICSRAPTDARWNAYFGGLTVSRANNFIIQGNLTNALSLLRNLSSLVRTHPSTMEKPVLARKTYVQSKIWRYQGNFQMAYESLKGQLSNLTAEDISGNLGGICCGIYSQHAAVLCELGRADEVSPLLAEKIKIMRELGWQQLSRTKSLQLALAEVLIEQHLYDEAAKIYAELDNTYRDPRDTMTNFNSMRLCIGRARISYAKGAWSDAHAHWNQVLATAEKVKWSEGFAQMIAYYSLAHISSKLHLTEQAYMYRYKAESLFPVVGRQHWFTCLGTFWLSMIQEALREKENACMSSTISPLVSIS